jgi:hypothetical protein
MNPRKNHTEGLRPEEKEQPWSFIECKQHSKSLLSHTENYYCDDKNN